MLRKVLAARVEPDRATPECLDDDTIAALAEGSLGPAIRPPAVTHLASCAHCRRAVASVARALDDRAVARELTLGRGRWRFLRIALPAAAAAVLLLVSWPPAATDWGSGHRDPPHGAAAPSPLSPVGAVANVALLRWTSVTGADGYRVTLFDAQGRVLFDMEVGDTIARLPDSLVFAPGQPYLWKVEARTGWDRWSASELVQFSVPGPAGP